MPHEPKALKTLNAEAYTLRRQVQACVLKAGEDEMWIEELQEECAALRADKDKIQQALTMQMRVATEQVALNPKP